MPGRRSGRVSGSGRGGLRSRRRWPGQRTSTPAALPYNEDVLAHVRDWRAKGGRTALVTATDRSVAEAIAAHLNCFDEVHGSDGTINLKGPAKAEFLAGRHGPAGFDYMGDARADLPVWARARRAITVDAPATPAPGCRGCGCGRSTSSRPSAWGRGLSQGAEAASMGQERSSLPGATGRPCDRSGGLVGGARGVRRLQPDRLRVYVLNDLLDLAAGQGASEEMQSSACLGRSADPARLADGAGALRGGVSPGAGLHALALRAAALGLFRADHGLFADAQAPVDHRHLHAGRALHHAADRWRRRRGHRALALAHGVLDIPLPLARCGQAPGRTHLRSRSRAARARRDGPMWWAICRSSL